MKRTLAALALAASFGIAAPALAQDTDEFGVNDEFVVGDYEYDNDLGFDDEGLVNGDDDYVFGDGADRLSSDDYGYYDGANGWETDDSRWDRWYGNADDDWADTYDDVGDEGLFDV